MISRLALAAGLVCAAGLPAQAGPDSVAVLLGTYHVNADGFEEVNPGVFLTWHEVALQGRIDLGFGAFRNSYGKGSVALTAAYPLLRNPEWGVDVFSALAWYPDDGDRFAVAFGDVVPLAGIQARWRNAFVQAIPGGGGGVDATLTYGLTFLLK